MASTKVSNPILYLLDWNVGKDSDDPDDPFKAGRICFASASDDILRTLLDHERMPDGIQVVLTNDKSFLVWTLMGHPDRNDGQVQMSNLDGSNVRTLYRAGDIHTPKQLAVDLPHGKIYICDREGLRVHRSNLDGTEKEVLVQRGDWHRSEERENRNLHCVGICLDTAARKFYWTQKGPSKGGTGKIYRASMDMPAGMTSQDRDDIELLFDALPEPIDLALDADEQLLYWTDRGDVPKGNTLNVAHLRHPVIDVGQRQYTILARHMHEAIGLELDHHAKYIYVSDLGGCVYRYDMDGKNVKKLFEGQGVYTGIALAYLDEEQIRSMSKVG